MEDTVTRMILEELKDIKQDINTIMSKLDDSIKDRATLNAKIEAAQLRIAQIEIQVAAINKTYADMQKNTIWHKIPEKILSWAVPFIMAALFWAFLNGFGK